MLWKSVVLVAAAISVTYMDVEIDVWRNVDEVYGQKIDEKEHRTGIYIPARNDCYGKPFQAPSEGQTYQEPDSTSIGQGCIDVIIL